MSSWYVLSSLGLYQLCIGNPAYTLTSPLFDRADVQLEGGRTLTPELFGELYDDEVAKLGENFTDAAALFRDVATRTPLADFLTLPGYARLA